MPTKRPPCNLPAEQCVLGTLIKQPDLFPKVAFLEPDYFYDPIHKLIFENWLEYVDLWEPDLTGLETLDLSEVGGPAYIAQLMHGYVDPERILDNALASTRHGKSVRHGTKTPLMEDGLTVPAKPLKCCGSYLRNSRRGNGDGYRNAAETAEAATVSWGL